jgi:tetratricopeptide (TPR) repeat protein
MTKSEDRFQKAMNQGHSAAWDQEWDRAASFYRQALSERPDDIKALTSLALALFELQEHEESLTYYQRLAKLSPQDPVPLEKAATIYQYLDKPNYAAETAVLAAELYLKNRDVDKAIENWSRAIVMNPEHLRAHSRLAVVYERLGRKPQAVREYLHIASLMQNADDIEKAAQAVNRALTILPDSEEAIQALDMLREGNLLPKPARPRGGTGPMPDIDTLQLEPPRPFETEESDLNPIEEAQQEALSIMAGLFFEQSLEQEEEHAARTDFQGIVSGTGPLLLKTTDRTSIMLHLSQAVDAQTRGDISQAANELERAIDAGLDNIAVYFNLGALRAEADRLESAIRHLQRAVSHAEFALGSRLLLGQTMLKMGRTNNAVIEYMEALKLADSMVVSPQHSDGLRQLYEPLIEAQVQQVGDEERQKELCESIDDLLVRPKWRQHLKGVRTQLVSAEGEESPTPLAEVLTEARSSQVVDAMAMVRRLARDGYPRAAMEEAFYALQHVPTYLPLHISIAELLLNQERLPEAIDKFKVVARSYSVRGESNRAIDMLRRIVQMSPMDLDARGRLINQLVSAGEIDMALNEYIQLGEVHYSMAELTKARKTYSQALREAQQAGVETEWGARILHRIADIDVQSLDWRQAVRVYEQICTLKPDDQKACNNLIDLNFRLGQRENALEALDRLITYQNKNERKDTVVVFLEQLLQERPQQAMIRRRLGEQYQRVGRTSDAIKQFDTAGEILLDTGDRAGAVEVIQLIIKLKPPNVADYERLVERIQSN